MGQGNSPEGRTTLEGLQRQLDELRLRALRVTDDFDFGKLKSFMDKRVFQEALKPPNVLIDSGATNIMRQPKGEEEWSSASKVNVVLANNESAQLYQNSAGSILASSLDIQSLLPMGDLVKIGCEVHWGKKGLRIRHPTLGVLKTTLRSGCPELNLAQAQNLFDQIEAERIRELEKGARELEVKLDHLMAKENENWSTSFERFVKTGKKIDLWKGVEGSFLKGLSPVTRDALPVDVNIEKGWETLKATSWNRRRRKLLLSSTRWLVQLCPHQEGAPSFASLEDNGLTCVTVSGRIPWEMFGVLLWGAATGRIEVIVGAGGYASSSDETTKERLAQMILLYVVTRFGSPSRRTGFVWVGPEMMSPGGPEEAVMGEFESSAGMKSQKFDQGALGGGPRRSSRLLSNYDLNHLDGLRQPEEGSCGGKDTSRQWPRQLEVHVQKVVGEARFAPTTGSLRAMTKQAWEDHARSGHYPYRRDCLQCVLHGATGHRHKRIEHPSMFVLTTDISGPFKQEGLNANARGDKRQNAKMKHLWVGRFSIPKAYVTGAWDTVRDSREEVEYEDLHEGDGG